MPENSTVILAFYDHTLIDIGGSKYSQWEKSEDGKELRVVKHTRVADFFSASITGPDREAIASIGVNFTLGFIQGQLLSYSDGRIDILLVSAQIEGKSSIQYSSGFYYVKSCNCNISKIASSQFFFAKLLNASNVVVFLVKI